MTADDALREMEVIAHDIEFCPTSRCGSCKNGGIKIEMARLAIEAELAALREKVAMYEGQEKSRARSRIGANE